MAEDPTKFSWRGSKGTTPAQGQSPEPPWGAQSAQLPQPGNQVPAHGAAPTPAGWQGRGLGPLREWRPGARSSGPFFVLSQDPAGTRRERGHGSTLRARAGEEGPRAPAPPSRLPSTTRSFLRGRTRGQAPSLGPHTPGRSGHRPGPCCFGSLPPVPGSLSDTGLWHDFSHQRAARRTLTWSPDLGLKLGQELPYFRGHVLRSVGGLRDGLPVHSLLLTVKSQFEKLRERGEF